MGTRILIVEDDAAIASMVDLVLRTNAYETVVCSRGDTALQAFQEHRPDLILLDVMLPGRNGFDVARDIRALSDVPIVMLTAKTDTEDIVRGLELSGADDYITKPCLPRVLLARIRARLRVHDQHPIEIGEIVIDIKGHRVTRNGEEVSLTRKEFELLKYLATSPGTVFSREKLLRDVWQHRDVVDTRLVNVHVQRLRSKIERDPEHPEVILSVRGVGYKAGFPGL